MEQIASDVVIDEAYEWLCRRRADYSDSNYVWNLRVGTYVLGPVELIRGEERTVELWSSMDALVLKAAAIVMSVELNPVISEDCFHIAGNGGSKGAVRAVAENLEGNSSDKTFIGRISRGFDFLGISLRHCLILLFKGLYGPPHVGSH